MSLRLLFLRALKDPALLATQPAAHWQHLLALGRVHGISGRWHTQLEALGVLNDDTISRERRILRARYQLIELATGKVILDATAGSDAGIDVVSSEYATIAAEQKALENLALKLAEQMATQVSLALRTRAAAAQ